MTIHDSEDLAKARAYQDGVRDGAKKMRDAMLQELTSLWDTNRWGNLDHLATMLGRVPLPGE
jgi:hypothetical protein